MAQAMKDRFFNREMVCDLARRVQLVHPAFDGEGFKRGVLGYGWQDLALKARMRRIAQMLGRHLPEEYEAALGVLDGVVAGYPEGHNDLALMCLPDFVEVYGQGEEHWDLSVAALERYTPFSTSEFAVRPFILKDEGRMMAQMEAWAGHENEHVRRLASEGCRPALPWGQGLPRFKQDPAPVLRVLERLKADPSLYVRKSVGNNLNDISKTHPALVAKLAAEWYGENERTNWIVKHGCRTLLKKGHRETLALFGFGDAEGAEVYNFALGSDSVPMGEELGFSFTVEMGRVGRVRLEYGIDYVKANGERSRKIFQIAEPTMKAGEKREYARAHSFRDMSTRRHYPGRHAVTLIVNGAERGTLDFEVLAGE